MAGPIMHPILLVDDEAEILYSLRGLLRREFDIHTAQGGAEALQLLQQQPIHVVMTDQRMPEMTGVELLSKVQEQYPEVIRIVFTGYADIKAVINAINEGHIYRYITKPWDPEELQAVLHQACEAYNDLAARKVLATNLHAYVSQSLALLKVLREQCGGSLDAAEKVEMDQLSATGQSLLKGLEQRPAQATG